jgi:hypothetical protein
MSNGSRIVAPCLALLLALPALPVRGAEPSELVALITDIADWINR